MINRSLFKQSCKANGTMWLVITVAVCFMLACVMLIGGGSNLSQTKHAIEDTIIQGELESGIQKRSINYYVTDDKALAYFDESLREETTRISSSEEIQSFISETIARLIAEGVPFNEVEAKAMAIVKEKIGPMVYANSINRLKAYVLELSESLGYSKDSQEEAELMGIVFGVLNPLQEDGTYMFDSFYEDLEIDAPRYDIEGAISNDFDLEKRALYRKNYVATNASTFLAGNLIKSENIEAILAELSGYGVTLEKYKEFGFDDFSKNKEIANLALVNFRSNYAYRVENMKEGETLESIELELTEKLTQSLLSSLPKEVASGIEEIGKADLYGTLIGSIFFKMAGLLLPIIFIIMTANNLVAGQVDSGSMAYILSSSTKRKTVMLTQALYLITAIFTMILGTTITSLICFSIVDVETGLTYGKLLLINLGAFIVLFAMSGICYLASCWFNRSKRSMAIGGGITMFFLVATMLGLFGSSVLPSVIRIDALDAFNKVSIISLFDVISILNGGYDYLWKFAILVGVGIICYIIGALHFEKKDLPL